VALGDDDARQADLARKARLGRKATAKPEKLPDLRRNHTDADAAEHDTTERRAAERDTPDPGHR